MIKRLWFTILIFVLALSAMLTNAQESSLTAEELRNFEVVTIHSGEDRSGRVIGSEGQYELRSVPLNPPLFELQLFNVGESTLVHDFGTTSDVEIINDSLLLWVGIPSSQSPQLYSLDELAVVGEFPLGARVYPRKWGEGFFYVLGNQAYFQSPDFSEEAVMLVGNLGYTDAYTGDIKESPDGRTVLIAGQNMTVLYDIEEGRVVNEIAYPLIQAVTLSSDGTRWSAVTNYDVYSSMASNWIVYDLVTEEVLVELYGERGSHGIISPDGKYAAVSQLVTDSRMGVLHVYDLDTGEELLQVENISHGGIPGQLAFMFVGEQLVFLREWNGQIGLLSVYDPSSNQVTELDIPVMQIMDALYRWFGVPTLSDNTTMIQIMRPDGFGIFDSETLELVRSFPSYASYTPDAHTFTVNIGNTATSLVYAMPNEELPALPSLAGVTQSDNINVRAEPSTNGERLASASGEVIAIGRNVDSTWVLLLSHGGWVSADLLTLEGDIENLTVVP